MGRRRRNRSFWSVCNTTEMHCFCFPHSSEVTRLKIHWLFSNLEAAVLIAASKPSQNFCLGKSVCFGRKNRDVLRELSFVRVNKSCSLKFVASHHLYHGRKYSRNLSVDSWPYLNESSIIRSLITDEGALVWTVACRILHLLLDRHSL